MSQDAFRERLVLGSDSKAWDAGEHVPPALQSKRLQDGGSLWPPWRRAALLRTTQAAGHGKGASGTSSHACAGRKTHVTTSLVCR